MKELLIHVTIWMNLSDMKLRQVRHKWVHIIQFSSNEVLESAKISCGDRNQMSCCQEWLKAWKVASVQFSRSVLSDFLRLHESQHARPPCQSQTPGVYSNSCPSSQWCHPAISSSVIPFSSCSQSLPASGSFPISQLFAWSGQSIGVSASASVLPMNIQDWFPLGWTSWISFQSKGLSRVFSNITVQKH